MPVKLTSVLPTFIWLSGIFLATFLMENLLIGNNAWDIKLHSSYSEKSNRIGKIPVYTLIIFLVFFIKECRHRYKRILPACIIIINGLISIWLLPVLMNKWVYLVMAYTESDHSVFLQRPPYLFGMLQVMISLCLIIVASLHFRNK